MTFHIVTIFPNIFDSYINESILKRAQKNNIIKIKIHNLRDWTKDKHKTVDDAPYGGGPGMVMKIEPIYQAIKAIKHKSPHWSRTGTKTRKHKVILLSAKGKQWNQPRAKKFAKLDEIILICGHYEGIDERVKKFVDEEISIGNYILTGGEIAALAIIDSIARLLSGTLGNVESIKYESHSTPGLLEYPQYTRPEIFKIKKRKYKVPKILLSGHHKEIEKWREKHSKKIISKL